MRLSAARNAANLAAASLLLAAGLLYALQEWRSSLRRNYSSIPQAEWLVIDGQKCPICQGDGVYRGGLVVWDKQEGYCPEGYPCDEDDTLVTKAAPQPVYWCPSDGAIFSRRARLQPESGPVSAGLSGPSAED